MANAAQRVLRERSRSLATGLTSLPDARGWAESGVWALLLVAVAAPLAWGSGLLVPGATVPLGLRTLLEPFLVPALVEEIIFRGLLLPHPRASGLHVQHRARWWAASLTLYVAAHPAAALFRPPAAGVFDSPAFLLEAGLLGVATTALYERTGSLWPGVLLHGGLVAAWLNLGGAALLAG